MDGIRETAPRFEGPFSHLVVDPVSLSRHQRSVAKGPAPAERRSHYYRGSSRTTLSACFSLRDLGTDSDATQVLDKIWARKFHLTYGWRWGGESHGSHAVGWLSSERIAGRINGSNRDNGEVMRTRCSGRCTTVRGIVARGEREAERAEFGHLRGAASVPGRMEASGIESAAGWRAGRAGQVAGEHNPVSLSGGVRFRDRR